MKKYLLLFVLIIIGMFGTLAQTLHPVNPRKSKPNPKLSATDRKIYLLSIDSKKIKLYDSIAFYRKYTSHKKLLHFMSIPVKLTNRGDDTLKYMSMTCSYYEFYIIDNNNFHLEMGVCFKNIPTDLTLAPHKSNMVWLHVFSEKTLTKNTKLHVGMILRKLVNSKKTYFDDVDFFGDFTLRKDKQDVIWSNPITISAH